MLYRSLPDPSPPADADLDTPAMAAAEADVERGERHLRVLARLTEIAMNLAEALGRQVEARIEATNQGDVSPAPAEDPAAATFMKMAQTVRRTVALEAKLAQAVKLRRDSLVAERAGRRADRDKTRESAKTKAILDGFHDAYAGSSSDAEYEDLIERLMEDAEEYLGDADEMRGYLDRPVGETVAKLCAAVGLDPDACALDGAAWRVRRPPTEFEHLLDERKRKYPPSPEVGRDRSRSDQGGEVSMKPHKAVESAILPHPGCSASGPSP